MKAKVAWVIGVVVAALLILTVLIGLLVFVPQRQTASIRHEATRLEREDNARRTLAQIIGGFVVLAGAGIAWWRLRVAQEELRVTREGLQVAREELRVAQEGQVTERFSRAIEHLGDDSLDVRLGAIYALERIARDSRQDHGPIMEILTAYVRERAPLPEDQQQTNDTPRLATDIQAALTVLGRRTTDYDPPGLELELRNTDLRGADLDKANMRGVILVWANLRGVLLRNANLREAHLNEANLKEADLTGANLQGASLTGAKAEGAYLARVNLEGAYLIGANLEGADLTKAILHEAHLNEVNLQIAFLTGANLASADLRRADLSEAIGLTSQQLEEAQGDGKTKLPPGVERPGHWPAEREDGG